MRRSPLFLWSWMVLGGCLDLGSVQDARVADTDSAAALDASEPDGSPTSDASIATPDAAMSVCVPGSVDPSTPGLELRIVRYDMDPRTLVVPVGSVVVFRNSDSMDHRMVSGAPGDRITPAEGGFDTRELAPGRAYAHRFCSAAQLLYYCSLHESRMRGYLLDIR